MTLVEFLRARLDEDERISLLRGGWRSWSRPPESGDEVVDGDGGVVATTRYAEHIARHDPARVLDEVDAKRRIVEDCASYEAEDHAPTDALSWRVLLLLALPYADHPDYDPAWRP